MQAEIYRLTFYHDKKGYNSGMDSASSIFLLKKLSKIAVICIAIVGVAANIAISQFLPASYFSFIEGDKDSTIYFLKSVKTLPEFSTIAARQRNVFGQDIDIELFDGETKREVEIFQLEKMLVYNAKSRDVLYGLYKLYKAQGSTEKAQMYLQRAKDVDPMVGQDK